MISLMDYALVATVTVLLLVMQCPTMLSQPQPSQDNVNCTFTTQGDVKMTEDERRMVSAQCVCVRLKSGHTHRDGEFDVTVSVTDDTVVEVLNVTALGVMSDSRDCRSGDRRSLAWNVTLHALFIGKTTIRILPKEGESTSIPLLVSVLREPTVFNTLFTMSTAALTGLSTVAFTATVDRRVVVEHFKKPVGIIIGFCCQYIIMPVATFTLCKAFQLSGGQAFGLLCYGASPGSGLSNLWTILLKGDLSLSIVMTFVNIVASVGMTPLWVFTLGRFFSGTIVVPFIHIVVVMALLVVTSLVGLLIGRFLPRVAKLLARLIRPASVVIIVYIVTLGVYSNLYMFRLMSTWRLTLSSILVSYVGYLVSLCLARLVLRRDWKLTRTIVIETGIQNGGIAIVMVRYSLGQPDSDLASVAPVLGMLTGSGPLIILWIAMLIRSRRRKSHKSLEEEKEAAGVDNTCLDVDVCVPNGIAGNYPDVGCAVVTRRIENHPQFGRVWTTEIDKSNSIFHIGNGSTSVNCAYMYESTV